MSSAMLEGRSKAAVIFSGGPAPGANAVISSVALSFLDAGIPIIGILAGYSKIIDYDRSKDELKEGEHYICFDYKSGQFRNERGIIIQTARANPGKTIKKPDDLNDENKTKLLNNILNAFEDLDVGLLISIGGDDTLRTANLIHSMGLPAIHIPKTIDNDYFGIPWTFGYWTSVDVASKAILNLGADARATSTYFIAEIMGRKAGWLTYAAGIAGEAIKMIAVEDLVPDEEFIDIDAICSDIVDTIIKREEQGRYYGVVVVAEGLVDRLPDYLRPTEKDPFGHTILGQAEIGKVIAKGVERFYNERTDSKIKIKGKQIGYETRTAQPISFDVVLGSTLGYGAYKLFSTGKIGHMVSVKDQFDIVPIDFSELIDPETLTTKVRTVPENSDFYHLKNALTYKEPEIKE